MRAEELPGPFVETILTGWWTTCLEILPAKELRAREVVIAFAVAAGWRLYDTESTQRTVIPSVLARDLA